MESRKLRVKTIQTDLTSHIDFCPVGVRKTTDIFRSVHFIENITQTILYSINLEMASVIVGGDGRIYSKEAIERVIRVLAGNSVRRVIIGLNGWLTMHSATCLMRERHCHTGFIFTGGHHPPGDNGGCLGLKIISPPGVPIRSEVITKATGLVKSLQSYRSCESLPLDFSELGEKEYMIAGGRFAIEVVDPVQPYVKEMKKMFDFPELKAYLQSEIKVLINCCSGVVGPCARSIFVEELGMQDQYVLHSVPLEDFGGLSPDPNLTTHREFVDLVKEEYSHIGALITPDGCRYMLLGEGGFFVSPSDSLALIAAHSQSIPFFRENPLETVVRSICTSRAVHKVAQKCSLLCFEVLPGWKNYSTALLPPQGSSILYGEESFGVGVSSYSFSSDRDGIWAVLAWLSMLSSTKKSVRQLLEEHWMTFGRSFSGRLDFKNVPHMTMDLVLAYFREKNSLRFDKIKSGNFADVEYLDPFGVDPRLQTKEAKKKNTEIVFDVENYVHPYGFIKKSLLREDQYQIYQIYLMEDAKLIIRKSESTSNSSTLRFYLEYNVSNTSDKLLASREEVLEPFVNAALKITKIKDFLPKNVSPLFI